MLAFGLLILWWPIPYDDPKLDKLWVEAMISADKERVDGALDIKDDIKGDTKGGGISRAE